MPLSNNLEPEPDPGALCLIGTMQKSLIAFLREAADSLRELALRTPDIANELRRFAGDLEREAERAYRNGGTPEDDAAD